MEPAWKFAPDASLEMARPRGGRIQVAYPYNQIRYRLRPEVQHVPARS